MQNQSAITEIRSAGLGRVNRLVRAAGELEALRPAFLEWEAGEIYVCKKTATYRYRHGARSKSVALWSAAAQRAFSSPAAFAFAAMVLVPEPAAADETVNVPAPAPVRAERVNVIALAAA